MNKSKIFGVFFTLALIQTSSVYASDDNFINITFKSDLNDKYLKVINLISDTTISEKITSKTYKIKIKNDIKTYKDFFSMLPDIDKVTDFKSDKPNGSIIDGHILVRFKSNVSKEDIKKLDQKFKTKSELISSELGLYKVILPSTTSVINGIKQFTETKMIEYAEPDRVMKIQSSGFGIKSVNLNQEKRILISFKSGSDKILPDLFNIIYNQKLVKDNNWYSMKLSNNLSEESLIKAFKVSPYIENVKLFSGKNNE